MLQSRKVTFSLFKCCAVVLLTMLLSGCALTFVKRYPKGKPFVYQTNVRVQEAKNAAERNELQARLLEQLDDSLRVRTRSYPLWKTINRPPVFDTNNVVRTRGFMTALLRSLGYFSSDIRDTFDIDTVHGDQYRTTVDFFIKPGKNLTVDSIDYALTTPEWQALVKQYQRQSTLKKGQPYSKGAVAQELDRLVNLLRNNGYYKVSREDIYAEVDTVAAALIDPTLDPFEQAILLEQLQSRRQNPTIDVIFKQRAGRDTANHPYYINTVTIYPDVPAAIDTFENVRRDTMHIGKFVIITRSEKFRRRFLTTYTALKPGQVYRQDDYFKTINTFNQLGAWQQANVDVFENTQNDSLLDVEITLYPAKKFTAIFDVELSRNNANNANPDLVAASNLFGLGFNVGFRNRNFARQSIQTTTNARVGFELGKNVFQTFQTSLSHNIYIPKFLPPWSYAMKNRDSIESPRTVISINGAYTDRRNFFKLVSSNLALGWEWVHKNKVWLFRPLNIEYTILTKSDSLNKLQDKNPYLKYAFNDGLVIGMQGAFRWQKQVGKHFHSLRITGEESGAIVGLSKQLDTKGKLFRFIKGDVEYKHLIQLRKSALAMRVFGGMGAAYGDSSRGVKERSLPFFKQYVAGGPNSMRAWQVRQLGWGSNIPPNDTTFRDRFGDMQLEANIEYRFHVATLPGGIKLGSALYVDAGNIWLRKTFNDPALDNAEFNLGRLGQDIAVGAGTGLRFDFNFFLIRLDYAYKVKDPQRRRLGEREWFYNWGPFNGQFQLGINYPF